MSFVLSPVSQDRGPDGAAVVVLGVSATAWAALADAGIGADRLDPDATAVFLEGRADGPMPGPVVDDLPTGDPPARNAVAAALSWLRAGADRVALAGAAGGFVVLKRWADLAGGRGYCVVDLAPHGSRALFDAVRAFGAEPAITGAWPLLLSARSDAQLRARAGQVAEQLLADLYIADFGASLAAEATAGCRAAVVGADRAGLRAGFQALAGGCDHEGVVHGTSDARGGVVMVFAGAGGQWRGMGGGLWDDSPVFRESVLACADAFEPYVDWSLVDVVRGRRGAASMNRVDVVQPALFTVAVSLAAVWRAFGVHPAAVVGHSQGEIAAACVAGALSLVDAARVVAVRSRIIAETLAGKGAMLSVPLPAAEVRRRVARWDDRVAVAAVNGPATTSVAGAPDAIEEFFAQLVDEGVRVARIVADFASHSAQVGEIRSALLEGMGEIRHQATDIAFCSAVTGDVLDATQLDTEYWYRNLRMPVEFDSAVRSLLGRGFRTFIEPSSHPLLTAPVEEIARDAGARVTVVGSLRMGESDAQRMLTSLATAHVNGVPVDWSAVYRPAMSRVPGDVSHG
ncbi:acyltransferase domain-containing protein [Actinocrispum sp. NPDC049592]|uniref:acyltransferase domain-containing protein n=1 Tax=Actinocrispum sp. NPDC049592 TaxID=3154835 RepID=UPI00341F44F5